MTRRNTPAPITGSPDMISLKRIVKDYKDSGALNALVNIHAGVGENVFLTKSGGLVMILALRGVDYEGLETVLDLRGKLWHLLSGPQTVWRQTLSTEIAATQLMEEIGRAREFLAGKVASFAVQVQDLVGVEILDTARAFAFLRRL